MRKRKKKKHKIIKIIILLILLSALGYFLYSKFTEFTEEETQKNFLAEINYTRSGTITYYDIYGIHMNFEGEFTLEDDFTNPKLVLANGNDEIEIDWELTEEDSFTFKTSEYINEGINLEDLENGTYYLLIKSEKTTEEETIYEYIPLVNETEYSDLVYYTLTENNQNQEIDITWENYQNNEILCFNIANVDLPDDVYDITIDPGHDGNDAGTVVCRDGSVPSSSGTCSNSEAYNEADLNFIVASALKEELENLGYKVKLTRDSKTDTVTTYGEMGSATTANATKSKFNFALHHNSSNVPGGSSSVYGLEVYVAGNSSFEFAELLVKNITETANTSVSTKEEYKVLNGIYQRFLDDGITPYYYTVREVGGIATYAYADGSDTTYGLNPYYNSNNTAESYLLELGYIDNVSELENILQNPESYAKGIATALSEYLN